MPVCLSICLSCTVQVLVLYCTRSISSWPVDEVVENCTRTVQVLYSYWFNWRMADSKYNVRLTWPSVLASSTNILYSYTESTVHGIRVATVLAVLVPVQYVYPCQYLCTSTAVLVLVLATGKYSTRTVHVLVLSPIQYLYSTQYVRTGKVTVHVLAVRVLITICTVQVLRLRAAAAGSLHMAVLYSVRRTVLVL